MEAQLPACARTAVAEYLSMLRRVALDHDFNGYAPRRVQSENIIDGKPESAPERALLAVYEGYDAFGSRRHFNHPSGNARFGSSAHDSACVVATTTTVDETTTLTFETAYEKAGGLGLTLKATVRDDGFDVRTYPAQWRSDPRSAIERFARDVWYKDTVGRQAKRDAAQSTLEEGECGWLYLTAMGISPADVRKLCQDADEPTQDVATLKLQIQRLEHTVDVLTRNITPHQYQPYDDAYFEHNYTTQLDS
jgi:hypothetical protein